MTKGRHASRLRDLPERVGRYHVRTVLGTGGFAVVVRAYDEALDGDVAIKILDASHAENPEIHVRFLREAQLLRRVHSPHVVAVHDIGELEDGRPYLVMELAGGGSLSDRLPPGTGVDSESLVTVIRALAEGLEALHGAGVVHRDVKPANLLILARRDTRALTTSATSARRSLLDSDERLVIGDLGLAKDQDRTSSEPTILGGTPHYCAPEQTQLGALITPAADVFAATGVIWRLVTGDLPPPPAEVRPRLVGVLPSWHEFFERGLAVEPAERFATMSEWEAAASQTIGGSPTRSGTVRLSVAQPGTTCPYKGLAAFQPDDAALFFGREELIDRLVTRLQSASTLVIGGPSGSGKSSLLRAGLIPAIEAGALPGSQGWPVLLFTPGGHALVELIQALSDLATGPEQVPSLAQLRAEPRSVRPIATSGKGALIAIDQFEELFTLNSDADVAAFVAVLAEVVAPAASRVRIAISLRADFYGECAHHGWLARCINENQVLVGPLQRAELRSAIEKPAQRVGLRLEDGLVDAILDDGAAAGSLPLTAHALMETWLRRRGTLLTLEGFRSAGGVVGAITQRANAQYEQLERDERAVAQRLFLRLVNPGEGTPDTRRRVTWRELGDDPMQRRVIDALADARLLTVDDDSVEIAHEAIIQSWPLLRGWIEEARGDLRFRQHIDGAAAEWDSQSRNAALLYRGTPLEAALAWAADHPGELGPLEAEFLDTSEDVRRAEVEVAATERRRRRRVRRVAVSALAALAGAAIVATAIAFVALQRSRADEREASQRFANLLGTQALGEARRDPLLALALAAESIARSDTPPVDAERALIVGRTQLADTVGPVPARAPFAVGDARTLTMTPDGSIIATGSRTGEVTLWDPATGERRGRLTEPTGGIQDLAVDPDGQWLVAGDDNGQVWRWDLRTPGDPPTESFLDIGVDGRNNVVWGVAFSPDGETLALGTEFAGVLLVDVTTGEERAVPGTEEESDFLSVAFSPDGSRLLAGTGAGDVVTFSLPSGERIGEAVRAHPSDDVWDLAFDQSGRTLVTGSSDATARAWNASTMTPVGDPLLALDEELKGIVFAGDGKTLYVGASDGTLRTFDLSTSSEVDATELGHAEEVIAAAGSDDGRLLATLGDDEQVRLWRIQSYPPVGVTRAELGGPATGIALDPTGERIAVSDADGNVHVLDVGPGVTTAAATTLPGHSGRVFGLAYLTSRALVTGDGAGVLRRWDPGTGRLGAERPGAHQGRIMGVAASPDGTLLATIGADGTARVWNAEDLSPHTDALETDAAGGGDVTFTPTGDRVIVASGRWVSVWTTDGERVSAFEAGKDVIWGVAMSPDGSLIATASADLTVAIWALDDPSAVQHRLGHSGVATDVVFSADGETLITTSRAGEVRFWDRRSGQLLGEPYEADTDSIGEVWRVAYDPERSQVWFAGEDGDVRAIDALDLELACETAGDVLDLRQRERYLGGERAIGCS